MTRGQRNLPGRRSPAPLQKGARCLSACALLGARAQASGLHHRGPGLQTRARPCPVASATSHRLGPGPMIPSDSKGPKCPRFPWVPGSLPPALGGFFFLKADKAGSSTAKTKIFPGSLYLLIFQFLAAAFRAGAGPGRTLQRLLLPSVHRWPKARAGGIAP